MMGERAALICGAGTGDGQLCMMSWSVMWVGQDECDAY